MSAKGGLKLDYYESAVIGYLRADRAIFLNAECCVQLNEADNPDTSGPHWYCDAVACDFRAQTIFLCETSYSRGLSQLSNRLIGWHENWDLVRVALMRDCRLPDGWPIRPWMFVPEACIPLLLRRLKQLAGAVGTLRFEPRITPLEMVQPWRYRFWNRNGEEPKPSSIPESMRL